MRREFQTLASDHPFLSDDGSRLQAAADRLLNVTRVRLDRLWAYYRNPMRVDLALDPNGQQRPYRQAQEWGLPSRITGQISGQSAFDATVVPDVARKEVVIENDIGWRVETHVDFLFGHPIVLNSASPDPVKRAQLDQLLRMILANNGGLIFLQRLAVLGAVYGGVDVLVKFVPDDASHVPADVCPTQLLGDQSAAAAVPPPGLPHAGPAPDADASPADAKGDADPVLHPATADQLSPPALERLARSVKFEIVDPTRALPLLETNDCRCVHAFGTVYQLPRTSPKPADLPPRTKWWQLSLSRNTPSHNDNELTTVIELITDHAWQRYDDGVLTGSGDNSLGRLPLVHIQNTADPMGYDGVSDVEQLIPLQDELNTRLSDRAYRIAMTSFKMYLGKGIENFTDLPVTPGRMWSTDNLQASVEEFGGDSGSPSEDSHIAEVREALDKLSGVSPIASGAIRGKIGNLTSAEALRVTMMALLSRVERKRTTYGTAVTQMCELALAWLDHAGVFKTTAADRAVQIHWPNPMPTDQGEQLTLAANKEKLGISQDTVLRELGYGPADASSVPEPLAGEG